MSRVMVDDTRRDAVFRKLRAKSGNKVRPSVPARRPGRVRATVILRCYGFGC